MEKRNIINNKSGGFIGNFILGMLFILLIVVLYLLFLTIQNLNADPIQFQVEDTINENLEEEKYTNFSYEENLQFYPNMRFSGKGLQYHISNTCSEDKEERVVQAMGRLEEETGLLKFTITFREDADILIECDEDKYEEIPGEHFIAGEGGPTKITNASKFYIIEEGKIFLFYSESRCDNSNIELHELLHVFGFDHIDNPKSMMYPTIECDQKLDDEIVDELKRLYSIKELPDLKFGEVDVVKRGSYLDFNLTIKNQGLKNAEGIELRIYHEEELLGDFDLKNLDYGRSKIFTVNNFEIGKFDIFRSKVEELTFVIHYSEEELEKENNNITLNIKE